MKGTKEAESDFKQFYLTLVVKDNLVSFSSRLQCVCVCAD